MKSHSIEVLEKLISEDLIPKKSKGPEDPDGFIDRVHKIKQQFQWELGRELSSVDFDQASTLVLGHEVLLCHLLETIGIHFKDGFDQPLNNLYQRIVEVLMELLNFLRHSFPAFFDLSIRAPQAFIQSQLGPLITKVTGLINTVEQEDVDRLLLDQIILIVQNSIQDKPSIPWTFSMVEYAAIVINGLLQPYRLTYPSETLSPLAVTLISVKFNAPSIMNVLFETIKRTLAGGSEGELPVLKKWRKSIHQIVERNHGPLYLELPSPKEVLANWLQEEIEYLETVEPKIDKADSQSKIHTSVSVPVLALFTRVLKESEFFTNTNQSEILKFISAHYTSLRKGSISYNHLQSKYYQFDEPTKKKLYEMLIGMANIVKKLN